MTAKQIIGLVAGALMFLAGLTLYIVSVISGRSDLLQPAFWLASVGGTALGLQITLPGNNPPA